MLPLCQEGRGDEKRLKNDSLEVAPEPSRAVGPDRPRVSAGGPAGLGAGSVRLGPCLPSSLRPFWGAGMVGLDL